MLQIPNRLNYLLWIQDVLDATTEDINDAPSVKGIDIGTGSTAIYPLLGCKMRSSWSFVGTELDPKSRACAISNVACNSMEDRIEIFEASAGGPLLGPLSSSEGPRYEFTMCNPPFYTSAQDVLRSAEGKELGPNGVCTGAEVEMITDGGEVAFVSRMISESLSHPSACRWYTSMVGKMSSLSTIVALLREHKINNYGLTELVQGQTKRWAVAWSFFDKRLPDELSRIPGTSSNSALLPSRGTLTQTLSAQGTPAGRIVTMLDEVLGDVERISQRSCEFLDPIWTQSSSVAQRHPTNSRLVLATENSWSRSARRRRKAELACVSANETRTESTPAQHPPQSEVVTPIMTVLLSLITRPEGEVSLECRSVTGNDLALFEGFFGYVSRKLEASVVES